MTRTVNNSAQEDFSDKKHDLLRLIDTQRISLYEASKLLNIPYQAAKQILFICGSPRQEALK